MEATGGGDTEYFDGPADEAEARRRVSEAMAQLKGYRVTANGAPVASRFELEPFALGKVQPFPGSEALEKIAGWMVSEVRFPAATPVALESRYAADDQGEATPASTASRATSSAAARGSSSSRPGPPPLVALAITPGFVSPLKTRRRRVERSPARR